MRLNNTGAEKAEKREGLHLSRPKIPTDSFRLKTAALRQVDDCTGSAVLVWPSWEGGGDSSALTSRLHTKLRGTMWFSEVQVWHQLEKSHFFLHYNVLSPLGIPTLCSVSQVLSSWGGWQKCLCEATPSITLLSENKQLLQLKQAGRRVSAEPSESSWSLTFNYKAFYSGVTKCN